MLPVFKRSAPFTRAASQTGSPGLKAAGGSCCLNHVSGSLSAASAAHILRPGTPKTSLRIPCVVHPADDAPSPRREPRVASFSSATAAGIWPFWIHQTGRLAYHGDVREWRSTQARQHSPEINEGRSTAAACFPWSATNISPGLFRCGAPLAQSAAAASGPSFHAAGPRRRLQPPVAMAHVERCSLFGISKRMTHERRSKLVLQRQDLRPAPSLPGKANRLEVRSARSDDPFPGRPCGPLRRSDRRPPPLPRPRRRAFKRSTRR